MLASDREARDLLDAEGVSRGAYSRPRTKEIRAAVRFGTRSTRSTWFATGPNGRRTSRFPRRTSITTSPTERSPRCRGSSRAKSIPTIPTSRRGRIRGRNGSRRHKRDRRQPHWDSTTIIIVWDDWGGFYDHVPPPFFDKQGGLGFRVPMLVVSPYVNAGKVNHTVFEFGSILKYVEETFKLASSIRPTSGPKR